MSRKGVASARQVETEKWDWGDFRRSKGVLAVVMHKEKKFEEWTYKDRNPWIISVMKSQKAAEDSKNKENIEYPRWFVEQ